MEWAWDFVLDTWQLYYFHNAVPVNGGEGSWNMSR